MAYISSIALVSALLISARAASQNGIGDKQIPAFGDEVPIAGLMERTDQDFLDGFALDVLSPRNLTVTVEQNFKPLSGAFVTGSSGGPFVALSAYSYIIRLNESANDMIAKIEIPWPENITELGINPANTFVGKLAGDEKSWEISESQRNVHITENRTRIVNLPSLDGEYILLGRQTEDTSNIFIQYGQGTTRTMNITGGQGKNFARFIDGLELTIISDVNATLNIDLNGQLDLAAIPPSSNLYNPWAWVVNTTRPEGFNEPAVIRFPLDSTRVGNADPNWIRAYRRNSSDPKLVFESIQPNEQRICPSLTHIEVEGRSLDGEYIIMLSNGTVMTEQSPNRLNNASIPTAIGNGNR